MGSEMCIRDRREMVELDVYLIRWKGKSPAEDTWLDRSELQQIDPDLLEYYESSFTRDSTESSSLPPGENDEDMASTPRKRRFEHVYQRRRRRLLLFGFSWSLYFQLESVFSFSIIHLVYF